MHRRPFPYPPRTAPHLAGFSLVELLLVLVILSAVLGMALPAMNSLIRQRSDAASIHKIRSVLLAARQNAIDSGAPTYVNNDSELFTTEQADLEHMSSQLTCLSFSPSGPICFRPDGTATDCTIAITSPSESWIGELSVIGPTGSVLNTGGSR